MSERSPATAVVGVVFVIVGTVLLLATAGVVSVRWDVLGPVLLMATGAARVLTGVAHSPHRQD